MEKKVLQKLLIEVAEGRITPGEAAEKLKTLPYEDIDFAKIDTHRALRTGRGEVIFGIGKTPEQVAEIMKRLSRDTSPVIATKVGPECFEAAREAVPAGLTYFETARLLVYRSGEGGSDCAAPCLSESDSTESLRFVGARAAATQGAQVDSYTSSPLQNKPARFVPPPSERDGAAQSLPGADDHIALVCAGTADIPIAEEAALTSEIYGVPVQRYYDVGVAGIHRLLDKVEDIRKAKAIIVVAGMEGALASVVGGFADVPVIAVPTSVGYGASMGGLTALLAMLNSCSLGVSVVNIDNGFGAGYLASLIVKGKE